jgi:hypothetical protein
MAYIARIGRDRDVLFRAVLDRNNGGVSRAPSGGDGWSWLALVPSMRGGLIKMTRGPLFVSTHACNAAMTGVHSCRQRREGSRI